MALSPRRVSTRHQLSRPIALAGSIVLVGCYCALTVSAPALADTPDEHSVLISSRKSPTGVQHDNKTTAEFPLESREPPLAPVAVATDEQPKLATRPVGDAPLADAPAIESLLPAEKPPATRPEIPASVDAAKPAIAPVETRGAAQDGDVDIETPKFNGVQPGTTTLDQLLKAWGEPQQRFSESAGAQQLVYALSPFKSVQVGVANNKVESVLLELEQQAAPPQLATQLKLARFRPAAVRDQEGTELGIVYPERGVVFSFAPRAATPSVSHVLLEPLSAQPFILRAEEKLHGPYQQNLKDLQNALELDPTSAHAWWRQAEIEFATGRITAAEESASRAAQLVPPEASYRLRWAACLGQLEKYEQAVAETRRIAESSDAPAHIRAEALVQLARLRSILPSGSPTPVELYEQAIQMAGELSTAEEPVTRRAAKAVLIDAHLGMAREIAAGAWREKEEVVPLWLERASAFADNLIESEGAGPEVRLHVAVQALEILAAFPPSAGPAEWVREAEEAAAALLAAEKDELWQARIHWEAGQAFLHALRVEHARGHADQALQYGNTALAHFRDGARLREASPLGQHLVGRLYFHIGAVHAIHNRDHEAAVVWYEKAGPLLMRATPQVPGADARLHGDALVSMGVSYWEAGGRDRAIVLTQQGAEILDKAVQAGLAEGSALTIAYGNLANMHKVLGHSREADRYTEIAARFEETTQQ